MSITFLESFDNWTTRASAELGKWQTDTNGGFLTIVAGGGRNATAGLQFSFSSFGLVNSPGVFMQRTFTNLARQIFGIAVKVTQFDASLTWYPFQWLDSTTPQVSVGIDASGRIVVKSGNTNGTTLATSANTVIAATGVYYYLEFDITFNGATGSFTVRSNGVQVLTASNQNTAPSGNNQAGTFRIGALTTTSPYSISTVGVFDDMYTINPAVGAQNTSFLGDTRVFCCFPTSDGSPLNFTASPAGSHYLNVNQTEQDGDTTYNYDATASDIDVYGHTATPANTGTIFGVQLCQVSRKDSAAARSTANYLKSGGSNTTGTTQALSQSYAWYLDIVEVDPATTVAFTKAGFDATQIGVTVAA